MRGIESVTLVPMTRESIFDVPFEEFEFYNVTSDRKVWLYNRVAPSIPGWVVRDIDAFLDTFGSDLNRVSYFSLAPTGRFGYETFQAKSYIVDGDELVAVQFLRDLLEEHGSNLILHDIVPNSDATKWKFRYATKGVKSYDTIFGESNEVAERHFHKMSIGKPVAPPPPVPA